MRDSNEFITFTAHLKSEYGEILAKGQGSVNIAERYVTFTSDFVPQYHISTPMEVVRIFKGKEIHRFIGKIYLSSKTLMRIVDIRDELLPGAELCYCINMGLSAMVGPQIQAIPLKKIFTKQVKESRGIPTCLSIEILYITPSEVIFQFQEKVRMVQHGFFKETPWSPDVDLKIDSGFGFDIAIKAPLPVAFFSIEVIELLCFGVTPSYRCKVLELKEADQIALSAFLWQYTLQHKKLFPHQQTENGEEI